MPTNPTLTLYSPWARTWNPLPPSGIFADMYHFKRWVNVFWNTISEDVNSPLGVGNLWLFPEEKNVAAQPHPWPPTNQVQTCIFQIPLGEALKWYMSAKIPEGGEGFTFWPTDYISTHTIPERTLRSNSFPVFRRFCNWHSLLAQSHNTPLLPPKILHNDCLQVLLGHEDVLREIKDNAYANFWGVKEVYYGICAGSEFNILYGI